MTDHTKALADALERALSIIGPGWEDGQGRPLAAWHKKASKQLAAYRAAPGFSSGVSAQAPGVTAPSLTVGDSVAVPAGYRAVLVPDGEAPPEPDWDEVRRQAEVATGLKVEQHTFSIIIREVRRWITQQDQPAAQADRFKAGYEAAVNDSKTAQRAEFPIVSRWTGAAHEAGPKARVWVQFAEDGAEVEFAPFQPAAQAEPAPGLLMSMALRYDHGLGCPGHYDEVRKHLPDGHAWKNITHEQRLRATLSTMRQLWEEVAGHGFYRPEKEAEYAAMLASNPPAQAIAQTAAQVREEALEEAAKECERDLDSPELRRYGTAFAEAIRALKDAG